MMTVTVAESETTITELLDRALAGETIVVTRAGTPIAELRSLVPTRREAGGMTAETIEWLRSVRVAPTRIGNAADDVRAMRDEGL